MPSSPVVLVTGATTGIGRALSQHLIKSGYRVALSARSTSLSRLNKMDLPKNQTLAVALDVEDSEQTQSAIQKVLNHWGQIDVLVNNAGISYRAVWQDMDEKALHHQFEVNVFGPMRLVQAVIPHMKAQGQGKIINISSVGGMMAMPTMGAYNASKFALEGASEALWYEMKPFGIKVVLVEPGFVHSEAFRRAILTQKAEHSLQSENEYRVVYEEMYDFIGKMMNWSRATPEKIAYKIEKVIRTKNPPLRVAGTPDARFFSILRRIIPGRWYTPFLYRNLPHIKK